MIIAERKGRPISKQKEKERMGGRLGWKQSGTYELVGEEQNCFERKVAIAHFEEVLEGRTEEIDNHDVVVALLS